MGGPICNVNIVELRKEICSMKRYGYHRTSTREQHLDRGIKEITTYCEQNQLELEKIYTDQQTGKNFIRPRYQVLKEDVLRDGDELIITEVDRLGRNKQETLKELQYTEKIIFASRYWNYQLPSWIFQSLIIRWLKC